MLPCLLLPYQQGPPFFILLLDLTCFGMAFEDHKVLKIEIPKSISDSLESLELSYFMSININLTVTMST